MTWLDFNWNPAKNRNTNPIKNWIPIFNWIGQTSTFGVKIHFFFDYVPHFVVFVSKHRTTQHGGREGEQEQVTMCWLQTTVYSSEAIDRQSVSPVIVRGLCDVWNKINSPTFVTDEQNAFSLCPPEGPENLVVVRIHCVSVVCTEPHMYPQSSVPSNV